MPCTPTPSRASLTSSSLNGLMTATTSFIGQNLLARRAGTTRAPPRAPAWGGARRPGRGRPGGRGGGRVPGGRAEASDALREGVASLGVLAEVQAGGLILAGDPQADHGPGDLERSEG